MFADPVRACRADDTLTDRGGECRTRVERARQEGGCRPKVAACCALRRPSVACHADARHGVRKTAQTSACVSRRGSFFFPVQMCERCAPLWRLGRFLNHVDEDRHHANDVNVSFSPVHENTRLHTRDRTRGAANRRGRREWPLEGELNSGINGQVAVQLCRCLAREKKCGSPAEGDA